MADGEMFWDGHRWREPWDAHLVEPDIELVWEDPPPPRSTPVEIAPRRPERIDPYGRRRRYTGDPRNPARGGLPSLGKRYS